MFNLKSTNVSMSMCWDFIGHIKMCSKEVKIVFEARGASTLRGISFVYGKSGFLSLTEKRNLFAFENGKCLKNLMACTWRHTKKPRRNSKDILTNVILRFYIAIVTNESSTKTFHRKDSWLEIYFTTYLKLSFYLSLINSDEISSCLIA